ncbi:hypothetical protein LEP1GSC125_2524 [Leptospira mayottensis 200901122]|uniref:Uncharacterized protein n=1 Tax=Leptospira mayottensis 200901122 TaxID=1193010 RepID=A0AA87MQZ8_9LEPT|nr:hypothetical protein LEP1GSC125_2524 [Leptospira mayottensis 200901122]
MLKKCSGNMGESTSFFCKKTLFIRKSMEPFPEELKLSRPSMET